MAASEEEIQRLLDAVSRYGMSLESARKDLNTFGGSIGKTAMHYGKVGSVLDNLKSSIEDTSSSMDQNVKTLRKEAADKLRASRASNITAKEKQKLESEANELKQKSIQIQQDLADAQAEYARGLNRNLISNVIGSVFKIGAEYVKGSAEMGSTLLKGVQAQSDSLQVASDLLVKQLEKEMKMFDAAIGGIGNVASMFGPVVSGIANTLTGVASAAKDGYAYLSREGIERLSTEIVKTRDNLVKMSNAGGFFAGGMTELRTSANQAGMRLDDYSNTIISAGDDLRVFGATQADAMAMVQKTISSMGTEADYSLRRLGYSVTDITELTAEYMGNLARTGTLAGMGQEALAKGSYEYMTNLKVISSITGEEAKAAQQRAREASMQSAVFAKLSGMGGNATDQFQALVKMMPGFEKELQQMLLTGQSSNAAFVQSPAFKIAQNALSKLGSDITGTNLAVSMQDQISAAGPALEQYIKETSAAGIGALYGNNTEFSDSLGSLVSLRQQARRSASEIEEDIRAQAKAGDQLTDETVRLQKNFEAVSVEIEQRFTKDGALASFATGLNNITGKTKEYADVLVKSMLALRPDLVKNAEQGGVLQDLVSEVGAQTTLNATAGATGASITTTAGQEINRLDEVDRRVSALEERLGRKATVSERVEIEQGTFAKGGVLAGPTSGYKPNIIMHGTEAIVPLGDGGVPVNSPAMEKLAAALEADIASRGNATVDVKALIDKLVDVNNTAKAQVEMSKRIIERLEAANSVSKQILQVTR